MSEWTHVAGVIRFDALRTTGDRRPNLGKTVNGYERDRKKWDAVNVPCGSEGSIQNSTWVNPHRNHAAAYVCTFWGDLCDYKNVDEIIAYFERITKGKIVRQMSVEIDTGAKVVLLRMENDHLLVIGHEVHASLLEQLPLAARLEEADWWHKNGDWSKAPYKEFAEHRIAGLKRSLQDSQEAKRRSALRK